MTLIGYCGRLDLVVPLAHRVGNPPPKFVGRDAEATRLFELLRSATFAVVQGTSGSGKRTLVRNVIHRKFRARVEHSLQLQLDCAIDPIAMTINNALQCAIDATAATPAPSDQASAHRATLDLGEALAGIVVLEVSNASSELWELASVFARYARATQWIIITADAAPASLMEYLVELGPLNSDALGQLWAAWMPSKAFEAQRDMGIAAAAGSPRRLRHLCSALRSNATLLNSTLATLLAHVQCVVPRAIVAKLLPQSAAEIAELNALGLLLENQHGLTLLPELQRQITQQLPHETARQLVAELRSGDQDDLREEALAIALDYQLDATAYAILQTSPAPRATSRAAAKISNSKASLFAPWRLRAATDLGDSNVLRRLPRPPSDQDAVLWAEGQARAGNVDAAIADADAAAMRLPIEDADKARLLAARLLGTHGDIEAALQRCDEITSPALRLRTLALRARYAVNLGKLTAAEVSIAEVTRVLCSLEEPLTLHFAEIWLQLAAAHHDAAQLPECAAIIARLNTTPSEGFTPFFRRRVALLQAALLADEGHLQASEAALATAIDVAAEASLHHPFAALIRCQLALVRGDTALAVGHASDLAVTNPGLLGAWATYLLTRTALQAPSCAPAPRSKNLLLDQCTAVHRLRLALRHDGFAPPPAQQCEGTDWRLASLALQWERATLAADINAVEIARNAAALAARVGLACWVAEAVTGECEALSALGDFVNLRNAATRLAALASQLESPRFADDARLFLAIAGDTPNEYERLAGGRGPSARRAQYLLGDQQRADYLDRAVCAHRQPAGVRATTQTEWRSGWGLDHAKRRVWRRDGELVEFQSRPMLWRLLELLVAAQNDASKEFLVQQAWGNVYHPLFHDKRLHNAIHKLRALIDGPHSASSLIETTEAGYRLNRDVPLRVFSATTDAYAVPA